MFKIGFCYPMGWDVAALRENWAAMTDTHQFLTMVHRLGMNRLGAYRIAGPAHVRRLAATAVYDALSAGQWDVAGLMLHPYLHWTWPEGTVTRGRRQVLAALREAPERLCPAASVQLRDDQARASGKIALQIARTGHRRAHSSPRRLQRQMGIAQQNIHIRQFKCVVALWDQCVERAKG